LLTHARDTYRIAGERILDRRGALDSPSGVPKGREVRIPLPANHFTIECSEALLDPSVMRLEHLLTVLLVALYLAVTPQPLATNRRGADDVTEKERPQHELGRS